MKLHMCKAVLIIVALVLSSVRAETFSGDHTLGFPGIGLVIPIGAVTGNIDIDNNLIEMDAFYSQVLGDVTIQSQELLPTGLHYRDNGIGGLYEINVGPEQLGGYFEVYSASDNVIYYIPVLWEKVVIPDGFRLQLIDGDADGTPGIAQQGWRHNRVTFGFELVVIQPLPDVEVSLIIHGGLMHECSETGGHKIQASANVNLLNGAELENISWSVDGQPVTTGDQLDKFLTLGEHQVLVKATTTTGESDSVSKVVLISDTEPPHITANFIDSRTNGVITVIDAKNTSFIDVSMEASDVCDAFPSVQAFGGFSLVDGDRLKVQGNQDKVELTTSNIQMLVKAKDATGLESEIIKSLSITP